jgi:hypothetical protein
MESQAPRRSIANRLLRPGLLALGLTAALVVGVYAHDGGGGPGGGGPGGGPGGGITISAMNGSQLTLTTPDGWTRTIDATGVTIMNGTATAALGDLKVGASISLQQSRNFDGSVTITEIDIVAPDAEGTVTAVGDSSITVKTADGASLTINVTSSTTYTINGTTGALGGITVGNVVHADGTANADGTFTATSVHVQPASLRGTVTAVGASSITIADASGATATINVTSSTTYRNSAGSATLADVTVGSVVSAQGVRTSDGSLNATSVGIGTDLRDGGHGRGPGPRGFGGPGGPGAPGAPGAAAPSSDPNATPAPSASA